MKLKENEEKLIKEYIASVDGVINRYVPSTVAGQEEYARMIKYANLRARMLVTFFSPIQKGKKYRQIDLEEAINNEKQKK